MLARSLGLLALVTMMSAFGGAPAAIGLQRVFENMQGEGAIPADRKFDLGRVFVPDYLRAAQRSLVVK